MRLLFDNCFHLCDMMIQDSTNTFTSFVLIISWKICASDSTSSTSTGTVQYRYRTDDFRYYFYFYCSFYFYEGRIVAKQLFDHKLGIFQEKTRPVTLHHVSPWRYLKLRRYETNLFELSKMMI